MKSHSRVVLAIVSSVALAVSLGACGSSSSSSSKKEGGTLVIGSWGGDYDQFQKDAVVPAFNKINPNTKVVFSTSDSSTRKTKMMAEKSAKQGSYDVVGLGGQELDSAVQAGLLQKLDTSKIKRYDDQYDSIKNPYCIAHIQSPISIIYNADNVKTPPKDWSDLFNDDASLKKSGTWPGQWTEYVFYAAAVAQAGGQPGADWSAGYPIAQKAAKSMRSYGSAEQIGQALMSGEINYVIGPKARASMWAASSGKNIKSFIPASGTFAYTSNLCIPKNAKNVDAAYDYLNAALEDAPQQYFAKKMQYAPTIKGIKLSEDLQRTAGISDAEAKLVHSVDWSKQIDAAAKRNTLWQQWIQ